MRRSIWTWLGAACIVVTMYGAAFPSQSPAAAGAPELVSRATGSVGQAANDASIGPAISADGRYVAFESMATNLDPADADPFHDIYVRDLATDTTMLVSRATGAEGEKGNQNSFRPSISADGRFVGFTSNADNLTSESPGSAIQLYIRDLAAHTTTLVSRASGPDGAISNEPIESATLSANGRFVAFDTGASNLDPESSGHREIYVRDLVAQMTTLVSRASGLGGAVSGGFSFLPAISADGTRVAFTSESSVLEPALDKLGGLDSALFVRDLGAGTTSLVSRASGARGRLIGTSSIPSMSEDGNRITFEANATVQGERQPNTHVLLRQLSRERTTLVSRDYGAPNGKHREATRPAISGNGRLVSFTAGRKSLDPGGKLQGQGLFVRDLKARETIHIEGTPGAGSTKSLFSSLSADGRLIAFSSDRRNPRNDGLPGETEIFVSGLSD